MKSHIIKLLYVVSHVAITEGVKNQHTDGVGIYKRAHKELDRQLIIEALERCNNKQFEAAKMLGMNRGTFRNKAIDHGLI